MIRFFSDIEVLEKQYIDRKAETLLSNLSA